MDPAARVSLISAVTLLGRDYLQGIASESGKATWKQVKSLFGWTSDPRPEELPKLVSAEVAHSPKTAERLLRILEQSDCPTARRFVHHMTTHGGKVIVAHTRTHTPSI